MQIKMIFNQWKFLEIETHPTIIRRFSIKNALPDCSGTFCRYFGNFGHLHGCTSTRHASTTTTISRKIPGPISFGRRFEKWYHWEIQEYYKDTNPSQYYKKFATTYHIEWSLYLSEMIIVLIDRSKSKLQINYQILWFNQVNEKLWSIMCIMCF